MSEPEDMDFEFVEKLSHDVNLSLAHSELTRWGAPPRSEADKDKLLKSLFVSRAEYEQYVIDLREREEREQKEAVAREAAEQARLENDPKHWKRLYLRMVEREEERKRTHDMYLGMFMVCAIFVAIVYTLRLFHIV